MHKSMLTYFFAVTSWSLVTSTVLPDVPNFTFSQLEAARNGKDDLSEFQNVARNLGAFSVSELPEGPTYAKALEQLRLKGPDCLAKTNEGVFRTTFSDKVTRHTSAKASHLTDTEHPSCLDTSTIESTFDITGKLVHQLVASLMKDQLHQSPEYYTKGMDGLKEHPLRDSHHLDHVHLYTKPNEAAGPDSPDFTAPFHVDNGLFLLITPTPEHPLVVSNDRGQILKAGSGDLVVLFGRALQHWLLQNEADHDSALFRAAPHAVPTIAKNDLVKESRIVYARMYVAPEEAVPRPGSLLTFGDIFHGTEDSVHNQCASESVSSRQIRSTDSDSGNSTDSGSDEFTSAQRQMCAEGEVYCWMNCLQINPGCEFDVQTCTNSAGTFCCLEGDTECDLHDGTCQWKCPTN